MAEGQVFLQMEPLDINELARAHQESPRTEPTSRDPDELLARALTLLGSPLPAAQVRKLIATAANPMSIMEVVLASLPTPPLKGALERFLPCLLYTSPSPRD